MPSTMPATRQSIEITERSAPCRPPLHEPSSSEQPQQTQVLVVDPISRQHLPKLQRQREYKVEITINSDSARAAFDRQRPEIVVIAQDLPDCSGLTLASYLRQRAPTCLLLMLATSVNADLLLRAMRSGINDVLFRPFSIAQLEQSVARLARPLFQEEPLASPLDSRIAPLVGVPVPQIERALILHTLTVCRGNRVRAALLLGLPRRTLYNRLALYGQESPDTGSIPSDTDSDIHPHG